MWPASFLVLALIHSIYAENVITVYEGYMIGSQLPPAQLTGVPAHDHLLTRLPGTARVRGEYLLEGPMYIQMPSQDGHLITYFADEGLSSALSEPVMRPLRDFLLNNEKTRALIYRHSTFQDPHLMEINASEQYIPDNFQMGDYFAMLVRSQHIPIFLVAKEDYFDKIKLDEKGVKYIGKLSLSIETIQAKFIQA